jgi:hypothetical protein
MQKHLIVVASILVLAASSAPAWAKWGCGSQGIGAQGRTWNFASRAEAAKGALDECRRAGGHRCRLISCSARVDTEGQADAIWPPVGPDTTRCKGAGC